MKSAIGNQQSAMLLNFKSSEAFAIFHLKSPIGFGRVGL
jgi:hypothetical protein